MTDIRKQKYMVRLALFSSFVLGIALSRAGQVRSITDRVYSTDQVMRGQQIYKAQCGECHGDVMQGDSGPPLVGDSFLAKWSARPLTAVVDKIQKTMPFNTPGSLSRQQSMDLTAYILQNGKFAAGPAELKEAALSDITFPTVRTSTPSGPVPE